MIRLHNANPKEPKQSGNNSDRQLPRGRFELIDGYQNHVSPTVCTTPDRASLRLEQSESPLDDAAQRRPMPSLPWGRPRLSVLIYFSHFHDSPLPSLKKAVQW